MSEPVKIFLVGHCRPDAYALKAALGGRVEDVQFEMVGDQQALDAGLGSASLLLVNRVLDGDFDSASGIDLIKAVRARGDGPPAMLVSDLTEAQAAAEQAGAAPGFGKRGMYAEETRRRVRAALGRA